MIRVWSTCAGRNCCNSITLPLILLTNLDSVVDKYRTGVMSTTCYLLTDAISNWTLLLHGGILSQRLCWEQRQLRMSGSAYHIVKDDDLHCTAVAVFLPSVLWHCWLGIRKSIRPVKNWVMRCWRGYLSGVRSNALHVVQLMPLPPHHLMLH